MTTYQTVTELAKALLEARQRAAIIKAAVDASQEAWRAANAQLLIDAATAREVLADRETALRDYALQVYRETGDTRPGPGILVKSMLRLDYSDADALAWAKKHDVALALDKKLFEKIAKVTPPDFVRVGMDHQTTIATDLEAVLANDNADAAHAREVREHGHWAGDPLPTLIPVTLAEMTTSDGADEVRQQGDA